MPGIYRSIFTWVDNLAHCIPEWFLALIIRIAIASVFWRSAQTKFSGWEIFGQNWKFWNVSESAVLLFEYEYSLPLLPPELAAYMATLGEFFLSLALVLGVMTRLSALGLLVMTTVIQIFVYPDAWNVHILWAALLLYLIRHGAGAASVDAILTRRFL